VPEPLAKRTGGQAASGTLAFLVLLPALLLPACAPRHDLLAPPAPTVAPKAAAAAGPRPTPGASRPAARPVTLTFPAVAGECETPFVKRDGRRPDTADPPAVNSGSGWVEIPAKANGGKKPDDDKPGRLVFQVKVPAAGAYWLWARTLWPGGCGNSFWVLQAGHPRQLLGKDGTYDLWKWRRAPAQLVLGEGPNTVIFANRQDGVLLDEIQLTTGEAEPSGAVPADDGVIIAADAKG
jgi:hypothetical protein